MRTPKVQKLHQKLLALTKELTRLRIKHTKIVEKRLAAITREQKQKCSGGAGAVGAAISEMQRHIHNVKRLLARAEGDEYKFRVR